MIFQCQDLDRALEHPELMPDARAHAENCAECRRQLFLWAEISRLAPGLHEEWETPGLWPRIRAEIEAAAPRPRSRWFEWRWTYAVAAAVLVIAAVIAQPWRTRPQTPEFLTDRALQDVQQAEAAYAQSIAKLSAVAGPRLEQSPSPVAAVYREKLLVLDAAIEDVKAAAQSNRYNLYLQTQLASLYKEKQKTLQDWLENAKRN